MDSDRMDKAWKAFQYLGIGAIYCCAYLLIKHAPFYLNLAAAFHLAVLIIAPVRLWPAVLSITTAACAVYTWPRFGVAPFTNLSAAIAIFAYPANALPAAWFAKKRGLSLASGEARQVTTLFGTALIQGFFTTLAGLAYVLSCDMPIEAQRSSFWNVTELYSVGGILAVLVVLPAMLWVYHEASIRRKGVKSTDGYSDLAGLIVSAVSFCAIAIVLAHSVGPGKLLFPIRLAMFVVVVVCTLRQGWRGAIFSILIANIAIDLTQLHAGRDQDMATLHEVSIFLCGFALWVGAFVAKQRAATREMAADNVRLQERYRRHADAPLRMRQRHAELLDDLIQKLKDSEVELRDASGDRRLVQQLWWRVISRHRSVLRAQREALHPAVLESHGLRVALSSGPLAANLRSAGVRFHVHAVDSLDGIDPGMQAAMYQLVHDSISRRIESGAVGFVSLKMRCGRIGERRYLGIVINIAMSTGFAAERETAARGNDELADLADLFGGRLSERRTENRYRVNAVLFEDGVESILAPVALRA